MWFFILKMSALSQPEAVSAEVQLTVTFAKSELGGKLLGRRGSFSTWGLLTSPAHGAPCRLSRDHVTAARYR
jgi:hypothetical protein